ncbi:TolC family protein [Polaribacter sp. MSW13]|uniref:TolC family protein n=1 Tax=Polaribacter marinus TaxID=2916838 RepID=A0A9X1VS69_9FLAO|nr:TolC family protein [Polaribacter marinus]MCI2228541.1 TolC family protein [Polaribacter marinus]
MKLYIFLTSLLFAQLAFGQDNTTATKIWSFEDCLNYVIENNITIKDASLNKSIAAVSYNKAKSSRLPNLIGSASQNFSSGNTIDPITSDYVTKQVNSTNLGVTSAITLFQGNQINNQIKQSKTLLEQSALLEEETKNSIIISLLESYLQALFSKEDIVISENNLIASEKQVERAKARLEAGAITLSDFSEAQSQAATNKYTVIAAKNKYQQYIITLKQLLELPPTTELEIQTIDENKELLNLELNKTEIYSKALKHLPEVEASKLNITASTQQLDIAKGGFLPTLSLSGSVGSGYTSVNSTSFIDQLDLNFNQKIGLSLSIPIFNRNQTKSAVKTASYNIEKAEIQQQSIIKEVYKKVETAYQNVVSSQEQLVASESSKEAARQAYKLAQKKYELGGLSITDLVISQNTYTNAQQNYIQAKYLTILYHQLLQFYQGNNIKL